MLDENLVLKVIKEIFNVEKIDSLEIKQEKTVNLLIIFTLNQKKYLMKVLFRAPTTESEYYRLEKEALLMKQFKHYKSFSIPKERKQDIPVPEIFHIENDEEKIGYKFIIMEFLAEPNLDSIWEDLTTDDKKDIIKQLATITRNIHSNTFDMFGEIEEYDHPRRFYSFESFLKVNLRRFCIILCKNTLYPIDLITKVQLFFEKNIDKISFKTDPRLTHRDLTKQNILVRKELDNSWKVCAILDFEWSYAGNPLFDLLDIEEELVDMDLREVFFEEYFEGKRKNLNDLTLEKKLHSIYYSLESGAIGWVNFNPTNENIQYIINRLSNALM